MFDKKDDIPYCGVDRLKIARACPVLDRDVRNLYVHFIKERTEILRLKTYEKQPGPWTQDPILQKYKFTNTRREEDKETKWLLSNVINTAADETDKILNIALFRCINLGEFFDSVWGGAPTFREDMYGCNLQDSLAFFTRLMEKEKNTEYKGAMQSNAYFLSQMRRVANDLCKKTGHEALIYTNAALAYFIWYHRDTIFKAFQEKSPELVCKKLEEVPGFGPFMTYQIWVDFTFMASHAFSENEFVISGPGCDEGLSFLFADPDGLTTAEQMFWLRDHWVEVTGINTHALFLFLNPDQRNMGVMQIENSFCELAKYVKLSRGTKMRARYYTP